MSGLVPCKNPACRALVDPDRAKHTDGFCSSCTKYSSRRDSAAELNRKLHRPQ